MKHFEITVYGKVQGVGYRAAAGKKAELLGLKGFVMNNFSGSVYIEAEGDSGKLTEFLSWCHVGPSFAEVENVMFKEKPVQNYEFFEIRR
ncbi:MAG TPA: acylphosphatase [Bacteroidales bacterium]|nr:acylphosphatase [Bacteroidales bacterium]